MKKTTVGFAMTGSFCTFDAVLAQMRELVRRDYDVIPILSYHAAQLDTRFMQSEQLHRELKTITGRDAIQTLQQAEPIGPEKMTDIYLLAPATGNTIAKLVNGIFDTPALLGAKSHLRNDRPLVVAVSTNDALSSAAQNIGRLLMWRNVYLVPYRQDNALKKPRSLVADFSLIPKTIQSALCGIQLQPIICAPEGV